MFRTFILLDTGSIHPEAQNWAARVAANGGTVSNSTLKAVSDFCKETASIRSLFLRLNLICGENLNAALVPLYLGEKPGIVYGNTVDTNFNFVGGDYNERGLNGGLIGNGVNKYLDTGFIPNSIAAIGLNDSSYSCYVTTNNSSGRDFGAVGSITNNRVELISRQGSNTFHSIYSSSTANSYSNAKGHNLITRQNSFNYSYYKNNNLIFSTNLTSTSKPPVSVFIFSLNNNLTPSSYSNQRLAGYHFGKGLTSSQVSIFYIALQKFQTALNRQV